MSDNESNEIKHGRNQHSVDDPPWRNEDLLRELYVNRGLGTPTIGERLGCSYSTVNRWLEKFGIEKRPPLFERVPHFSTDSNGYEAWRTLVDGTQHGVYVHRLLAVAEYGFEATVGTDVHHKNGCKFDNRRENIELRNPHEHRSHHALERREEIREQARNQDREGGRWA